VIEAWHCNRESCMPRQTDRIGVDHFQIGKYIYMSTANIYIEFSPLPSDKLTQAHLSGAFAYRLDPHDAAELGRAVNALAVPIIRFDTSGWSLAND
jgi:hypothetical protein